MLAARNPFDSICYTAARHTSELQQPWLYQEKMEAFNYFFHSFL